MVQGSSRVMVWSGCNSRQNWFELTWSRVGGPVVDLVDQGVSGRL